MSNSEVLSGSPASSYELEIGGMTCSSCAMRIEKKLNKLDGVAASVNYATEKARVTVPVDFAAEAPTPGRYLLYFDFQVDGEVHTASFVVTTDGAAEPDGDVHSDEH